MNPMTTVFATLSAVLTVLLILSGVYGWYQSREVEKLNVSLGVVAGLSQAQEVKIVELKVIEEKIKVVTNERIKEVREHVYDENKSECDNAIDSMRGVF